MEFGWKTMKFPFQTWFWINRRILYLEMPFSYIKLFNWENIGYVAYPLEALFWSLKEDKYTHCRWMTSFVYLRNLATSDIPISGFPGCLGEVVIYSNLLTHHEHDGQCTIDIDRSQYLIMSTSSSCEIKRYDRHYIMKKMKTFVK